MWTCSGDAVGQKVEKQLEKKIAEKKGESAGRKKQAVQGRTKQQRQKMTRSEGDSNLRRVHRRCAKRAGIDTLRIGLDRLQQGTRSRNLPQLRVEPRRI